MESLRDSVDEIGAVLHRSLLVYGLNPEETNAISALGHEVSFSAGEHLIMAGTKDADLFVLIDGHVDVLTDDGDKLSEIMAGGILGEIAFVDAGPRHAYALATSFVKAVRFPARDLRAHLCRERSVGFIVLTNLARLMAARLRNADSRIDHLMDHEHDCWKECRILG